MDVRVHWTLLAYAGVLTIWPWPESARDVSWRLLAVAMIFASVLLHEFGHSFAARFCDGESSDILLWPLGGLAYVNLPSFPMAHFLTALAGPLVSLVIWAGASVAEMHAARWWAFVFSYVAEMNLAMVLLNLLPAIPLDGGRMLQAVLWRQMGQGRSTWICVHLAIGVAVLLFLYPLGGFSNGHINLLALGVALFIFFSALNERRMLAAEFSNAQYWESRPGVAWNHPYNTAATSRQPTRERSFANWWRKLVQRDPRRMTSDEDFMRDEIDPILDKISREGMQSLTARERKILESARDLLHKRQR